MNREELEKYKGITGYSLGQIEKDYFQHIVLGAISREAAGLLVFKGGTALQKTGIIRRFSEDLDFTEKKPIDQNKIYEITINSIKKYNFLVDSDKIIHNDRTNGFRIKIQGPLFKNQRGLCTIRVEISKREKVLLPLQKREFSPLYMDILPYILYMMSYDEILAEKIRTIYTRNKPRDLYDLYFLLKQQTKIDVNLINKKLSYYDLSFDKQTFLNHCKNLGKNWNNELSSLLEEIIPFNSVFSYIKDSINQQITE